jgi:hypothetical protein
MFSYLTVAGLLAISALLFLGLYLQHRHEARQYPPGQRSRWTNALDEPQA